MVATETIHSFSKEIITHWSALREKRVPLGCPLGTIATNVYETVPLHHWGTEIIPLKVPWYGQSNSAPRGTDSVPYVFWVSKIPCSLNRHNKFCWPLVNLTLGLYTEDPFLTFKFPVDIHDIIYTPLGALFAKRYQNITWNHGNGSSSWHGNGSTEECFWQ